MNHNGCNGQPWRAVHALSIQENRMNMPKWVFKYCVSVCLLTAGAVIASAQYEGELTAKRRLFPEVGAGLRAIKRGDSDKTYVLSSQGLMVFDAKDRKLLTIGSTATETPGSKTAATGAPTGGQSFAEDFDVDAAGQIYVADRAANLIVEFSADGKRLKSFRVNAPLSVVALPDGEVAVTTLHDRRLILVFDKNGTDIRDFGELEEISSREDLNRYLNAGYLANDARGNIYYAFIYTPRKPFNSPKSRHLPPRKLREKKSSARSARASSLPSDPSPPPLALFPQAEKSGWHFITGFCDLTRRAIAKPPTSCIPQTGRVWMPTAFWSRRIASSSAATLWASTNSSGPMSNWVSEPGTRDARSYLSIHANIGSCVDIQ
jgi:hypothetical protein